jgi:hypothetical protein
MMGLKVNKDLMERMVRMDKQVQLVIQALMVYKVY